MKRQAAASNANVTELEGAVLLEIDRIQGCTAYQVMQSFVRSPTPEWSASAGSIYPAIKRLAARNCVKRRARNDDGRSTETLSLTAAGKKALAEWANDLERLISPGQDPFRLRMTHWMKLNIKERRRFYGRIERAIEERLGFLENYADGAELDVQIRTELETELQKVRLAWLKNKKP